MKNISPPYKCDICKQKITDCFIDGKLKGRSSWANFCPSCHSWYGEGLGAGLGQKYFKANNTWEQEPSDSIKREQEKDISFACWMESVDEACYGEKGCSIYDLPDINFRDLYEAGYEPDEAVQEAIDSL